MFEACLDLRREMGNPKDIAATLSTLSLARLRGGDTDGAEQGEQEALKIFRSIQDRYGEAISLVHLGQICYRADKGSESRGYLQECLALAQKIGNKEVEGECHLVLGELAFDEGDFAGAENSFKRSLTLCRETGRQTRRGGRDAVAGQVRSAARRARAGGRAVPHRAARLLVVRDVGGTALLPRGRGQCRGGRGCCARSAPAVGRSGGPRAAATSAFTPRPRQRSRLGSVHCGRHSETNCFLQKRAKANGSISSRR